MNIIEQQEKHADKRAEAAERKFSEQQAASAEKRAEIEARKREVKQRKSTAKWHLEAREKKLGQLRKAIEEDKQALEDCEEELNELELEFENERSHSRRLEKQHRRSLEESIDEQRKIELHKRYLKSITDIADAAVEHAEQAIANGKPKTPREFNHVNGTAEQHLQNILNQNRRLQKLEVALGARKEVSFEPRQVDSQNIPDEALASMDATYARQLQQEELQQQQQQEYLKRMRPSSSLEFREANNNNNNNNNNPTNDPRHLPGPSRQPDRFPAMDIRQQRSTPRSSTPAPSSAQILPRQRNVLGDDDDDNDEDVDGGRARGVSRSKRSSGKGSGQRR